MPEQLVYTPKNSNANEHPSSMVLMVDEDMLNKYNAGDKTIPLAAVVVSFQVSKYETPGKEGRLASPSKSELLATFGTTNETEIVEFMLQNGQLHGRHRPGKVQKESDWTATEAHQIDTERRKY